MAEKRIFRTIDLLIMIGALIGGAFWVGHLLRGDSLSGLVRKAERDCENLGHQLLAVQAGEQAEGPGLKRRQISSESHGLSPQPGPRPKSVRGVFEREGRIGHDPWGRAYRYRFLISKNGNALGVMVWSEGPNKQRDTADSTLHSFEFESGGPLRPHLERLLAGDDLGRIVWVPM